MTEQSQTDALPGVSVYEGIVHHLARSEQGRKIMVGERDNFDMEEFEAYLESAPMGTITTPLDRRALLERAKREKKRTENEELKRLYHAIILACDVLVRAKRYRPSDVYAA